MLVIKGTNKTFLKADYDEKYGMPINDINDIVLCCMGYEEFETVSCYGIEEALNNVISDVRNGITNGFETFNELVDYTSRNYI